MLFGQNEVRFPDLHPLLLLENWNGDPFATGTVRPSFRVISEPGSSRIVALPDICVPEWYLWRDEVHASLDHTRRYASLVQRASDHEGDAVALHEPRDIEYKAHRLRRFGGRAYVSRFEVVRHLDEHSEDVAHWTYERVKASPDAPFIEKTDISVAIKGSQVMWMEVWTQARNDEPSAQLLGFIREAIGVLPRAFKRPGKRYVNLKDSAPYAVAKERGRMIEAVLKPLLTYRECAIRHVNMAVTLLTRAKVAQKVEAPKLALSFEL